MKNVPKQKWHQVPELKVPDPTGQRYADLAKNIAERITILIDRSGRFVYEFKIHPNGDTEISSGYNWLRHAGSIWAATTILNKNCSALERAFSRLVKQCMDTPWVHNKGSDGYYAKLGAQALAGLAASVQGEKGKLLSFQHSIFELENADDSDFTSEYYVGEALLLIATTGGTVMDITRYRNLYKEKYGINIQSHWMVYALAATGSNAAQKGDKELALLCTDYATDIVRNIINDDSYFIRGEATPIACRVEAVAQWLLLILPFISHNDVSAFPILFYRIELAVAAAEWIHKACGILEQFVTEQYYVVHNLKDQLAENRIRIDYLQHTASALHYSSQAITALAKVLRDINVNITGTKELLTTD